jgi:hypothetical protein
MSYKLGYNWVFPVANEIETEIYQLQVEIHLKKYLDYLINFVICDSYQLQHKL